MLRCYTALFGGFHVHPWPVWGLLVLGIELESDLGHLKDGQLGVHSHAHWRMMCWGVGCIIGADGLLAAAVEAPRPLVPGTHPFC